MRSLEDDIHSLLAVATLGALLLLAGSAALLWGLRRCRAWPARERWSFLGIGLITFLILEALAFLHPVHDADELNDFTQGLVGIFSGFDLSVLYHPTLYWNMSSALSALFLALRAVTSDAPFADAVVGGVVNETGALLVIARSLSALAWTGVSLGVFRLASRLAGLRAALLASFLLLAMPPLTLFYASDFSPFAPGVFFGLCFVSAASQGQRRPNGTQVALEPAGRRALWLGALFGAAVATLGLNLLFAPLGLLWLASRPRAERPRAALEAVSAAAAVYLVANPMFLYDPGAYLADWVYRLRHVAVEEQPLGRRTSALDLLSWFTGSKAALLGLLAFASSPRRAGYDGSFPWRTTVLVPALLLSMFLAVRTRHIHYLLFVVPWLAALGGAGFAGLLGRIKSQRGLAAATVTLAIGIGLSSASTLSERHGFGRQDPSIARAPEHPLQTARAWIDEELRDGETLALVSDELGWDRAVSKGKISTALAEALEVALARRLGAPRIRVQVYSADAGCEREIPVEALAADWIYVLSADLPDTGPAPVMTALDGRKVALDDRDRRLGVSHARTRVGPGQGSSSP